jgi:hypothetical protein
LAIFGVKKHIILKPMRGEKPSRTFPISPINPLDASEANATTMELQTLSGLYIHELKDLFSAERFKVWTVVNGQRGCIRGLNHKPNSSKADADAFVVTN